MTHTQERVFPEHSRNTPEHPELMFRGAPYVVGPRNTRGNDPGTVPCPVCGEPAIYDVVLDLYEHAGDVADRPCRMALLRGHQIEPPTPHALYRFWSGEELLYIGITLNPSSRWADHRRDKTWWEEITTITIERHASRARVLEAEREAIEAERPKYNVVWNHPRKSPRPSPPNRRPPCPSRPAARPRRRHRDRPTHRRRPSHVAPARRRGGRAPRHPECRRGPVRRRDRRAPTHPHPRQPGGKR